MKLPWGLQATDLDDIRGSIRLFAVAAGAWLLLGCLLGGGDYYLKQTISRQQQELLQAQGATVQAQDDKTTVRTYLQRYQHWVSRGVIGTEKRLTWVEALEAWNRDHPHQAVRYTVSARKSAPGMVEGSAVPEFVSPMDLEGSMLHEGDWLALLDWLNRRALGLPLVQYCVASIPPQLAAEEPANRINLRCELHWYSTVPDGGEEAPHAPN